MSLYIRGPPPPPMVSGQVPLSDFPSTPLTLLLAHESPAVFAASGVHALAPITTVLNKVFLASY